jgi:hypothetical protein
MSDDLDDLLRRAMKTLDEQVPSGYFDALPNQTLVRLEASMQMGTSGTSDPSAASSTKMAVATAATEPRQAEEDSGLHDIRSLAQSTKQRLTKRITMNPPMGDELAASSGAWKHVALPEPAKMVSLPSLDELPSVEEVLAAEKATKKAAKAPAVEAAAATEASEIAAKPAFSAWADRAPKKKSRAGLYAIVGVGLAAAAGALIFVKTQGGDKSAPAGATTIEAPSATDHRALAPAVTAPRAELAVGSTTPVDPAPALDTKTAADQGAIKERVDAPKTKNIGHAGKGATKPPVEKVDKVDKNDVKQGDTTKVDKKTGGKDGDPSFDDLLKEAGVDGQKKPDKPKLEKKSLSEADFKKGISAVAAKAAGCYKGTQGTATVKLTVAASGQVSKVSVGGLFSGKPEADCVANAVKSASFPPWDGGPQTFSYAYLLSE